MQDVFEYRISMFGRKNKMGGYKNPKLFLHRDPILYLWKDMKDQVVEELHSIYKNKSPQGIIFEGNSGSGASELIRSLSTELSACGLMDPVSLRYLKPNGQGGIYEALKEDIFPYGESIDQMLLRVQKQVQRYLGISPELRIELMSSSIDSSTTCVSVNRNATFSPSTPVLIMNTLISSLKSFKP